MDKDKLDALAERFEKRALKQLLAGNMAIDAELGLWKGGADISHIADCFAIAAALRSHAQKEAP